MEDKHELERIKEELEGNPALEEGTDDVDDEFAELDNREDQEEYDESSDDEEEEPSHVACHT